MSEPIRILMGSDYHFGAPNIDQEEMANAFAKTIFPLLEETDIFFINGDFFDTLVMFDHTGFDPIYATIVNLFQICERLQIKLRVLQGTFTHDRKQLHRFVTIYKNGGYGGYTFDFRLVEGIQLEEIWFGNRELRIVYAQDDLPFTNSDDIVDVIRQKMVELGWDHVDYGCMHGFFDFTAGGGMSHDKTVIYTSSQFPFVKKLINVGHVHQHAIFDAVPDSSYPMVISNGSFDRGVHGDEKPKGLIRVFDYPDHFTAQFIENEDAAIYDTIVFTKDDTTETIVARITHHIAQLRSQRKISLRFVVDLPEHREAIKVWMKDAFPNIRFQFKKSGEVEDKSSILTSSNLLKRTEKRPAPTPATIAAHIRAHMPESYVLSVEEIEQYLQPITDRR